MDDYELAMVIAVDARRSALVAELLERLRSLGLPDGGPDPSARLLPVDEPPHVSVSGRSALAGPGATVVPLEDRIVA